MPYCTGPDINPKHTNLSTFMAEVSAILNNRSLVPIYMDPDAPLVLRPSMLLTGKDDILPAFADKIDEKDKQQWKRVQFMADTFWRLWRRDYLQLLQSRRKWVTVKPNLKCGDVVILRESGEHRNCWPFGVIQRTFEREDQKVKKVEVRVVKDNKTVVYIRPINEVVLLID